MELTWKSPLKTSSLEIRVGRCCAGHQERKVINTVPKWWILRATIVTCQAKCAWVSKGMKITGRASHSLVGSEAS